MAAGFTWQEVEKNFITQEELKVGKWQLPQIVFKRQEEGKKIKCQQEIEFYRWQEEPKIFIWEEEQIFFYMTVFIGHQELQICKMTPPSKKKFAIGGKKIVRRRPANKIV